MKTIMNTKNFFRISLLTITLASIPVFGMETTKIKFRALKVYKTPLKESYLKLVKKIRMKMAFDFSSMKRSISKETSIIEGYRDAALAKDLNDILKQKSTTLSENDKKTASGHIQKLINLAAKRIQLSRLVDFYLKELKNIAKKIEQYEQLDVPLDEEKHKQKIEFYSTEVERLRRERVKIDEQIVKYANLLDVMFEKSGFKKTDWHPIIDKFIEWTWTYKAEKNKP